MRVRKIEKEREREREREREIHTRSAAVSEHKTKWSNGTDVVNVRPVRM